MDSRRGGFGPSAFYFRLSSGEEARVRFLEQDDDVAWTYCAEIPVPGRSFGRWVPIGIEDENQDLWELARSKGLRISFKGWINLIWFDAPLYKRDAANKIVKDSTGDPVVLGTKNQVCVWNSGIRLFDDLAEVNQTYKGLMSRHFRVKRKGERLDTKYKIVPWDIDAQQQEFSAEETELAGQKADLNQFIQPIPLEELLRELNGAANPQQSFDSGSPNPFTRTNPFTRR